MAGINLSVAKALDVLDLLGQADDGLRLKDIAIQLDLPESTTHRLLASLAARDYVQQRDGHGTYQLGWKIAVLARSLTSDLHLVDGLRPWLERLVRQLGQTVNLGVLSDDHVVYLDCQIPSHSLALYTPPGTSVPIHATALGKCLAAFLPASERDALLPRLTWTSFTPHTLASAHALGATLPAIRERGYAVDDGEFRAGVTCLAAPVLDDRGRALAAISVTAPTGELPRDWRETCAAALLTVTREAGASLFGAARGP